METCSSMQCRYKLLLGRQTKAQLSFPPGCWCREERLWRSTYSNSTSMLAALYQGHCSREQQWNKTRKKTNFKSYRLPLSFQYNFRDPPHYVFIHSVKFLQSLYYLFRQLISISSWSLFMPHQCEWCSSRWYFLLWSTHLANYQNRAIFLTSNRHPSIFLCLVEFLRNMACLRLFCQIWWSPI